MTKRVSAIEYDHQWNEVAQASFQFVEEAQEWCQARRRSSIPLEFGDTQIGLEGLGPEHVDSLDSTGDYAPGFPIFQIQAINDEDPAQIDELYSFHYDPAKMSDEDLKCAWDEATHFAEDAPEGDDQWKIVEELENEVNKRNLNQKGTAQ